MCILPCWRWCGKDMHEHVWVEKKSWIGYGLEGSHISRAFFDKTCSFQKTSNYPMGVAELKQGKNKCIIGWSRISIVSFWSHYKSHKCLIFHIFPRSNSCRVPEISRWCCRCKDPAYPGAGWSARQQRHLGGPFSGANRGALPRFDVVLYIYIYKMAIYMIYYGLIWFDVVFI